MNDLLVSVADSHQEKIMEAWLPRLPAASGTQPFSYFIIRNLGSDSGSYHDSHELLRPFVHQHRFALVLFDYEGCGAEHRKTRSQVEAEVEGMLAANGWAGRCAAIVVAPEIENWLWIDNPNVQEAIGWEATTSLYQWARATHRMGPGEMKPKQPKETLYEALRMSRTPVSSAIYRKIAAKVSYKKCEDPAFQKMLAQLLAWFAPAAP
jgi:hypothetical protein